MNGTTVTYPASTMLAVRYNKAMIRLCRSCRLRKFALRYYIALGQIEDGY